MKHPNIVGVDWHQCGDQPTVGRFDGENAQNGLVGICDTPYVETISAVCNIGCQLYQIRNASKK